MEIEPEVEKEIRSILTAWAAKLPHHAYQDFGRTVSLIQYSRRPSFIINLHTLYDVRSAPVECSRPFSDDLAGTTQGGEGSKTDVWSVPVQLKMDFSLQQQEVPIPNSFKSIPCVKCDEGKWNCDQCSGSGSINCSDCGGRGHKPCDKCNGRAKTPCEHCRGKGKISKSMSSTKKEEVQCDTCQGQGGFPCTQCNKGSLECKKCGTKGSFVCTKCKGAGNIPCPECGGTGNVLKGFQFQVSYNPTFERKVIHDGGLPQGLVPAELPVKRVGERVYEVDGAAIGTLEKPLPETSLDKPVADLLQKAELGKAKYPSPGKIIKQDLFIERISIYSVVYKFGDKIYSCWLTSLENKVVASESPFTDLARSWVRDAGEATRQKNFVKAQGLVSKAADLSPADPEVLESSDRIKAAELEEFLSLNWACSVAAGFGLPLVIASMNHRSHHLFWPLFLFGFCLTATGILTGNIISRKTGSWLAQAFTRRVGGAVASALAPAAVLLLIFSVSHPISSADQKELGKLLSDRFAGEMPEMLSTDDQSYLKALIAIYEPLNVDVSRLKGALDAQAHREDEAKLRQEEAARLEALRQQQLRQSRLEAERKQKALEDAKRKAALAKSKNKKSKKKKKK